MPFKKGSKGKREEMLKQGIKVIEYFLFPI
jgi:hypothetical protein